jgi:hypothetical protein
MGPRDAEPPAPRGPARRVDRREWWGYGFWLAVAVVVATPEISAAAGGHRVPWPTISGTVGHLEYRWSWVALLVVSLIVAGGFHAVRFSVPRNLDPTVRPGGRRLRTAKGRLLKTTTAAPSDAVAPDRSNVVEVEELSVLWLLGAAAVVAGASLVTALAVRPANPFILAYVLYGSIAMLFVVVPSVLAYWHGKDVAFPTLFWTLSTMERRFHLVAVALYAGLFILLFHLALYPWPGIFHVLRPTAPTVHSP